MFFLAKAIIRKRERENWANNLALKYGRIWLQKVRERKKNLPDEDHVSVWTHGRHLDTTVKQLKKETGRQDLGTVFMTAFKKALAEQLALEEKQSRSEVQVKGKEEEQMHVTKRKESEHQQDGNLSDEDDENDDEEDDEAGNMADEEYSEEEKSKRGNESSRGGTATDGGYEADEDEEDG